MATRQEILNKLEENLRGRDSLALLEDLDNRRFVPEAAELAKAILKERGLTVPERMTKAELSRRNRNRTIALFVGGALIAAVLYVLAHVFYTPHPWIMVRNTAFITGLAIVVIGMSLWFGDHSR